MSDFSRGFIAGAYLACALCTFGLIANQLIDSNPKAVDNEAEAIAVGLLTGAFWPIVVTLNVTDIGGDE